MDKTTGVNGAGEKTGQSSAQVRVEQVPQNLDAVTIPIPMNAQSLFAGDPKFLNSLIDTIKETVKAIQVDVHPGCITVTSQRSESMRRVEVLAEMIQDHMRQWHSLQRQVTGLDRRDALYTEEFAITRGRMRLAIGPRGDNINAARSIDDVEQVNNSDRFLNKSDFYLFQVKARTQEAAKEAREVLEMNCLTVKVPRDLVGRVIGTGGSNIQLVVDKTGVNRVSIDAESPEKKDDEGMVYFIFHGMGSTLVDAKVAITLLLNHAKRMDQMRKECLGGQDSTATAANGNERQERGGEERGGEERGGEEDGGGKPKQKTPGTRVR